MKVLIETIDDDEETIIIKCKQITPEIQKLHQLITSQMKPKFQLSYFKDDEEFIFPLDEILFFESEKDDIYAHTKDEAYKIKHRLYELDEKLPHNFIRVSKSTILNINHIFSIQKNITSSSRIQFRNSYKEVYVSRMYYKTLQHKLQERSHL